MQLISGRITSGDPRRSAIYHPHDEYTRLVFSSSTNIHHMYHIINIYKENESTMKLKILFLIYSMSVEKKITKKYIKKILNFINLFCL